MWIDVLWLVLALASPQLPPFESEPIDPSPASWQMYQAFSDHNAVFSGTQAHHWIIRTGRNNGGLAIVGNALLLTTMEKQVLAYDVDTGNPLWTASVDNIAMTTPVSLNGLVVVGTGKNGTLSDSSSIWGIAAGDDVIGLDLRSGKKIWAFHTVGEDMPSAVLTGNDVVFGNGDEHVYGLSRENGSLRWRHAIDGIVTMSSATLYDGIAYLGDCHTSPYRCETLGFDAHSGHLRFAAHYGSSDCSPTVTPSFIFVTQTRDVSGALHLGGVQSVYALDRQSGRLLWHYDGTPGTYTSVASQERAIAGMHDGNVYYQAFPNNDEIIAFDDRSGAIRWRFKTTGPVKMSPVVANGKLLFGDTSGVFYELRANDGTPLSISPFNAPFSTSPPVVRGETVYISNGDYLYAFPIDTGYY